MTGSEYKAPWGRLLRVTSISFTALIVGISLFLIVKAGSHLRGWHAAVAWLPTLILVSTVPFVVRRYRVRNDNLLVDRLFWPTVIPLAGLRSVEVMPNAMKGSLRLCGNGGLFSFTGWWWSKRLGRFRPYVNDLERTVVLKFDRNTIVLSPESPEEFARELTRFVTHPESSTPPLA